jgi:hypothetical protein
MAIENQGLTGGGGIGSALSGIANIIGAIKKPKKEKKEITIKKSGGLGAMGGNPLHYQTHVKQGESPKRSGGTRLHHGRS